MPVSVTVQATRTFRLLCSADEAFAFLLDIPASARLFPLLEEIGRAEALDEGAAQAWHSRLRSQGPPGYAVQPEYVCRYTADAAARQLRWTPVAETGTAAVSGRCSVQPDGASCVAELAIAMTTDIPAPRLARRAVQAAVQLGFEAAVLAYVRRLAAHLAPA